MERWKKHLDRKPDSNSKPDFRLYDAAARLDDRFLACSILRTSGNRALIGTDLAITGVIVKTMLYRYGSDNLYAEVIEAIEKHPEAKNIKSATNYMGVLEDRGMIKVQGARLVAGPKLEECLKDAVDGFLHMASMIQSNHR